MKPPSRYVKPMTIRESESLIAGAKNLERQVDGWKTFGWFVFFLGLLGYLVVAFIGWIAA